MAYSISTISSGPTNFIIAIHAFLLANGWTINKYDPTVGVTILQANKGGVYINFEYDSAIYLSVYGSTGYNGVASVSTQPGVSAPCRLDVSSDGAITVEIIMATVNNEFWLFGHNVATTSGYMIVGFGEVEKIGTYSGGNFLFTTPAHTTATATKIEQNYYSSLTHTYCGVQADNYGSAFENYTPGVGAWLQNVVNASTSQGYQAHMRGPANTAIAKAALVYQGSFVLPLFPIYFCIWDYILETDWRPIGVCAALKTIKPTELYDYKDVLTSSGKQYIVVGDGTTSVGAKNNLLLRVA